MSVMVREQIAANQQCRYERYLTFEAAAELRDELTDASERLAAPMENHVPLFLDEQGRIVSEHGQDMRIGVLDEGIKEAERAKALGQDVGPELERRIIERQLIEDYPALNDGDIVVHFSPIPDAVRQGQTSLGGYDRKRLKMLVRVGQRQGSQIDVIHFSLDRSDRRGLKAMADAFSHELPEELQSEAVLRSSLFLRDTEGITAKQVVDKLRSIYDHSLAEQFGGGWYAGRRPMSVKDALAFIKSQPSLIDDHIRTVRDIKHRLEGAARETALKGARFNFAAALDDVLAGRQVMSLQDAGDTARDEGRSFDGDCATFESPAQSIGMNQGNIKNGIMKCVTCPLPGCGATVDATVGGGIIGCPACHRGVDSKGNIINIGNSKRQKRTSFKERSAKQHPAPGDVRPPTRPKAKAAPIPPGYRMVFRPSIGGAEKVLVDRFGSIVEEPKS